MLAGQNGNSDAVHGLYLTCQLFYNRILGKCIESALIPRTSTVNIIKTFHISWRVFYYHCGIINKKHHKIKGKKEKNIFIFYKDFFHPLFFMVVCYRVTEIISIRS